MPDNRLARTRAVYEITTYKRLALDLYEYIKEEFDPLPTRANVRGSQEVIDGIEKFLRKRVKV
jgi:hypothetical protein